MKRIILSTVLSASVVTAAMGAVINATPGSLENNAEILNTTDATLEVTGSIDVRDLKAIASSSAIKNLDLSGVKIVSYTAASPDTHGQSYFSAGLIPQYAFFKSGITSVVLPDGVTEIGAGAFANSDLRSITLSSGLRVIGDHAFYGCADLKSVTLPGSVVKLGSYVFANSTSLETADLRSTTITTLPENTFSGCSALKGISLPVTLRTVGSHALEGTAITTLSLSQVTRFEDYALAGMPKLSEMTFSTKCSIGTGVLMDDTSLKTINNAPSTLPVLFAANCTGYDSSSVSSKSVKIEDYALANTTADKITLSPRLTYIGAGALKNINSLEMIDARSLGESIPDVDPTAFAGIDASAVHLYVEDNTEDLWKEHPVWKNFHIFSDATDVKVQPVFAPKNRVIYADGILTVTSSSEIKHIDVYTIDGARLLHAEPDATDYETSLVTSANVLIVRVNTTAGTESTKLLVY